MAVSIGMVCEGSHDFNVLKRFISSIFSENGIELSDIDCLQPQMSATFQTGTGGWSQVKMWCEADQGQYYRKFVDQPVFGSSKTYDIIIFHLDGDVVEHCNETPLKNLDIGTMSIHDIVTSLKSAIEDHWLDVEGSHSHRIVTCVPVRHLEAWLLAGVDANAQSPEDRALKDEFRNGAAKAFKGKPRQKYIKAANVAVRNLNWIRKLCYSFNVFESDVIASAKAV